MTAAPLPRPPALDPALHTWNALDADAIDQLARDLSPADLQALNRRVLELRSEAPAAPLVDAATLADVLGVTRDYVYRNAERLGGMRLPVARPGRRRDGATPKPRLRFDLEQARVALDSCPSSRRPSSPETPDRKPETTRAPSAAKRHAGPRVPIRGVRAA